MSNPVMPVTQYQLQPNLPVTVAVWPPEVYGQNVLKASQCLANQREIEPTSTSKLLTICQRLWYHVKPAEMSE